MARLRYFGSVLALFFLFTPLFLFATEFSSTNFQVLDPVIQPGGYSSSDSFQLHQVAAQISIGTSTASSFRVNSGFLFYPFVSTTTVTATAGDAQVSLSWSAFSGFLGWTVSGYNVGQATVSGGPYSFSASLGNVTSSTRTGLTNGTTYYFIVRVEDAFVNSIATSSQVSSAPVAGAVPAPAVGGDSGGLSFFQFAPIVSLTKRCGQADFNCDGRVSLGDFSIFLALGVFPPVNNVADINSDRRVNLADVSIFLSYLVEKRPLAFVKERPLAASLEKTFEKKRLKLPRGAQKERTAAVLKKAEPERLPIFDRLKAIWRSVVNLLK